MQCALHVIVLTNHGTKRDPWYQYMMKCVAIDQLQNLGFVENRYFTRGMGHQNQSKPSFTTISMISLAIYCLAKTWRKPWVKHVMTWRVIWTTPHPPPPRVCERCMAGRVFKDIQGTHTRTSLHWQTWWGPLWVHFQCWFLCYWRDVDSRGKNILQPHIYGMSQPSLWNLLSIGEHVHGWHHSWPQRAKPHRTQSLSKTCNQQSCNVMENGCSL